MQNKDNYQQKFNSKTLLELCWRPEHLNNSSQGLYPG